MTNIKNFIVFFCALGGLALLTPPVVMAQNYGSASPVPLNSILSGKSGSSSAVKVRPYTSLSSGAQYDVRMSPSDVMKNRARRDAYAEAKRDVALGELNQSYLDKEYQQAFQRYQAQFRKEGEQSSSPRSSLSKENIRVEYGKKEKQRLFVTPRRVFNGY